MTPARPDQIAALDHDRPKLPLPSKLMDELL